MQTKVIAYLGMGLIGVIGVPISFHYRPSQLRRIAELTQLKFLFIDEVFVRINGKQGYL